MVDFRTTQRVKTSDSSIKVDAGLSIGKYIFQLTAIDMNGNTSKPARLKVEIVRRSIIVGPVRPDPVIIRGPVIRGPVVLDPVVRDEPVLLGRVTREALNAAVESTPDSSKTTARGKSAIASTSAKAGLRKRNRKKKSDTDNT